MAMAKVNPIKRNVFYVMLEGNGIDGSLMGKSMTFTSSNKTLS